MGGLQAGGGVCLSSFSAVVGEVIALWGWKHGPRLSLGKGERERRTAAICGPQQLFLQALVSAQGLSSTLLARALCIRLHCLSCTPTPTPPHPASPSCSPTQHCVQKPVCTCDHDRNAPGVLTCTLLDTLCFIWRTVTNSCSPSRPSSLSKGFSNPPYTVHAGHPPQYMPFSGYSP